MMVCQTILLEVFDTFQMFDQLVIQTMSVQRGGCCLCIWRMSDVKEEGGVISKEIRKIFFTVKEIIDEN